MVPLSRRFSRFFFPLAMMTILELQEFLFFRVKNFDIADPMATGIHHPIFNGYYPSSFWKFGFNAQQES